MASQSFRAHGLVLKKTKLGETDLIITFLAEDGSHFEASAKGARKPQSSISSKVELFCELEMLLVKGKGLPIISESRLIDAHASLRSRLEQSAIASLIAELLVKSTHEELAIARLFELARTFLSELEKAELPQAYLLGISCMLKICAFCGVRPSFSVCVSCGNTLDIQTNTASVAFSFAEGGVVCSACRTDYEATFYDGNLILWLQTLLFMKFSEVDELTLGHSSLINLLSFCNQWVHFHLGVYLNSYAFVLSLLETAQRS